MNKYLITKEEIEQLDGMPKTHFLNDNARRINKSLGDLTGLTGIGFHIIEVKPSHQTTEFHKHYHEDECVYILDGKAEAIIGNKTYTVKAGDFIGYRADGEAHTLRNIGDSILRCIVVGERLDHDVGEYPGLGKRIYRQKNMHWHLVDIADVSEIPVTKK